MSDVWPRILSRKTTVLSEWMGVIAREVKFARDTEPQIYHAVDQRDYITALAVTPDGRFPIVRQYRPAIEGYSLELPGGLVDIGEDAAAAAARELREETGCAARTVHWLGTNWPCAGRLSNRMHSFFIEADEPDVNFRPEAGLSVEMVTAEELSELARSGRLMQQTHLGTLLQAELRGFIRLPH